MDNRNGFIYYKIFEPFENLVAFTTSKFTLQVKNPKFTGDTRDIYENNRQMLAEKLGIKSNQFVFPRQTHTNCVAEILEIPKTEIRETDALVTKEKGICICVQTADCVPVLLFDPVNKVISAIHAGWRGTVNKIAEVAVQKMVEEFRCNPENLVAAIGPSISANNYEVGNEVVQAVIGNIPNPDKILHKNNRGKFQLNLWEANRQILLKNGLQHNHIEIAGKCSFSETNHFFSARKEGITTGRMVSGLMLLE
ncbi:MAG TPA: peptidoglycan editing factor PgeF [Draconibacterium sp.]|nr:peptidoglycan editing factor PgeF [Draconibacterium sp.]